MIVEGGLNLKDIKKSPELKSSKDSIWGTLIDKIYNYFTSKLYSPFVFIEKDTKFRRILLFNLINNDRSI